MDTLTLNIQLHIRRLVIPCVMMVAGAAFMPADVAAQAMRSIGTTAPIEARADSVWLARTGVMAWQDAAPARSPIPTIVVHTAVGLGAGTLIGLALSGAATDDGTEVVLTWAALGAAAGLVSGVVTTVLGGSGR